MNSSLLISSILSLIGNIKNEGKENVKEQIAVIREELKQRNSVLVSQFDRLLEQL